MRCLFLHPQFRSESFWNYRDTCEAAGARYPAAPLGLITVAAMLPADWKVRLVDRNVEALREADWAWSDMVFIGGMIAQQLDSLDLVREAKRRGKTVVVGGPDATSSPHLYREADHLVLGEAELTMPRFLADFGAGVAQSVYEPAGFADITRSPCPRYDLLDFRKYLHVGVQWCRGCPFSCEFCDIIELFGRVPRAKTTEQMLGELQTLYDLGYRGHVDFVDDNFIGNKRLAKQFLPHLETWLEDRIWPFEFTTEASINLADDEELLGLMQRVGFFSIFVGIESPDEATLIAMKKRQNTHRSIAESIQKIYRYGIFVNAGYILGFDSEKGSVARGLIGCVEETGIPVNMVGLLFALPTTQLTRRLEKEGRLHASYELQPQGDGDQCTAGLNFDTLRPRAEILRDYLQVVETIYDPAAYFARVRRVALAIDASKRKYRPDRRRLLKDLRALGGIALAMTRRRGVRGPFWRLVFSVLRRNSAAMHHAISMSALYLHLGPFSRYLAGRTRAALERAELTPARPEPAPAAAAAPLARGAPAAVA
jgi:radical SAM superfamily enzyme YgiQ (UPF0313 family)